MKAREKQWAVVHRHSFRGSFPLGGQQASSTDKVSHVMLSRKKQTRGQHEQPRPAC